MERSFFFIYNNTRGVRRGNLCYTSKYLADMLRKKYRRKVRKMMYNLICHEAVGTVEADGVISGISFSILQSSVPHFKHQWNYDRFVPDQIMLIMADSPRSIYLLEYKPFLAILLILGSAFVRANVKLILCQNTPAVYCWAAREAIVDLNVWFTQSICHV